MKNPVIIKSFQHGLSIWLDEEMPFSQLIEEIAFKFRESAHFFKDASMVLSFEGRIRRNGRSSIRSRPILP